MIEHRNDSADANHSENRPDAHTYKVPGEDKTLNNSD